MTLVGCRCSRAVYVKTCAVLMSSSFDVLWLGLATLTSPSSDLQLLKFNVHQTTTNSPINR